MFFILGKNTCSHLTRKKLACPFILQFFVPRSKIHLPNSTILAHILMHI